MTTIPEDSTHHDVPIQRGLRRPRHRPLGYRRVRLVMFMDGSGTLTTARRVVAAAEVDLELPATLAHRCQGAPIRLDEAAHQSGR